jgi:hypothetical protein
MPRYALSREQSDALVVYLQTLYPVDPGVDAERLVLAVVIDRRLPEPVRKQHRRFLEQLVSMKNSGTRQEERRKRFAPVQKIPEYRAYRKWVLDFWELESPVDQWPAELLARYRERPAFALYAPLLQSGFEQLAGFCETRSVPCLFPPLDAAGETGFYSFVFDDVARRLEEYIDQKHLQGRALHVLAADGNLHPHEPGAELEPVPAAAWQRFRQRYRDLCGLQATVLVRLDDSVEPAEGVMECPTEARLQLRLLVSSSDGYDRFERLAGQMDGPGVCVVGNYADPGRVKLRSRRVEALTRRFGIDVIDSELLARDLFSFSLLADAINKLNGAFSRKYLLEVIEHMLNSFPNYTFFREISGAPNQRHIAGAWRETCAGERS